MAEEKELELWAESIVSGRTFEPLINIRLGETSIGQFGPDEAREFAGHVFAAAEAAEGDAFVFKWLTRDVIGTPEDDLENWREIMEEFKAFRELKRK